MKRVAINGLGRIGRLLLRRFMAADYHNFTLVAVNDPMPPEELTYLLKYDSVHGRAGFDVHIAAGKLWMNDRSLDWFQETRPANLPWQQIDVVIDSSGRFTQRAQAAQHIAAGARRVLISAPSPDADVTLVLGVNETTFDPHQHFVISNASCTTNSLAPALKVLDDHFTVEKVLVTTVHAYTSTQSLVDVPAAKQARGRAAAMNIIPTSTGAEAATELVLPHLKHRISAVAVRVPVADGSLTDISVVLDKCVTVAAVNHAFEAAAQGPLKGILAYSDEALVSSDIIGDPHSAIIHARSTRVIQNQLVKVQAWYDNEYGYACRCLDLLEVLPL